jgi:hypothetical protein
VDHLDSKNLMPFKKRRNAYLLPGLTKGIEEQVIDEVDPELRPEEQGYVRHYLGYADVMLKNAEAEAEAAPQEEPAQQSTSSEGPEQLHADNIVQCTDNENRDNVTEIPRRDQEDSNAA